MNQIDFIDGDSRTSPPPFKDIRNTRPSVAEEKATLVLQLGQLLREVPARVNAGGIQATREWLLAQSGAVKVAKNSRASVMDLEMAIRKMQRLAE